MLPLHDHNVSRTVPFITWLLILANVLVFFYELHLNMSSAASLDTFIDRFGTVPSRLLSDHSPEQFATLFTSMFIHSGWSHILGNMWFLLLFGDNVEDRLGHLKYLCFYILCGIGADLVQLLSNPHSAIPSVGASGCIAGILGAYLVMFPSAKVVTFNPILGLGSLGSLAFAATRSFFIRIPAFIFLGTWFIFQWLSGSMAFNSYTGEAATGGVAWWAHIGGFITGLVVFVLPPGPEVIESDPGDDFPRDRLDIPRSWKVQDDQLAAMDPVAAHYVTPQWFWTVMAGIAAICAIVLLFQIWQYKQHIGDWMSPPSIESVSDYYGLEKRFTRAEDFVSASRSPSVLLDAKTALWFLNDSRPARKSRIAEPNKKAMTKGTLKANAKAKGSKSKYSDAAPVSTLPTLGAQLDLVDISKTARLLLNSKSQEPAYLFGSTASGTVRRVLDAAMVDGRLYVFVSNRSQIDSQDDLLGQIELIQIANPFDSQENWKTVRKLVKPSGNFETYGLSCMFLDDYLYVFSTTYGDRERQVLVSRLDKRNLASMNSSAFTYLTTLDGTPIWSKNAAYARPVFHSLELDNLCIRRIQGIKGFFAFYSCDSYKKIAIRHNSKPDGAWSQGVELHSRPADTQYDIITVHPELTDKPGNAIITFHRYLPTSKSQSPAVSTNTAGALEVHLSAH